jgi:hypothetical protein
LSSTIDCAPVGNFDCPNPFTAGGGITPGPGGITTFPTIADQRAATAAQVPVNQKSPKSIDWTLGIQHTFWNDFTAEVRYLGTRGIHLPAQIRLNSQSVVTATNFLPTFTTAPDQATVDSSSLSLGDLENINPIVPAFDAAGFNGSLITSYQPWASSTYHGLATQLTKRMSHGVQLIGAYTYSHLIDDATAEVFSTVLAPRRAQDGLNLSADRANSILDHRHRFTMAVVYDVPYFKNGNRFLRNTVGNWEFAPVYTYQSGQWVTAQSGIDSNLNLDSAGDRNILNPGGTKGTGTGVSPLCRSAVPSPSCTFANVFCTGDVAIDGANSDCTPGVDVIDNVVGYMANNPNAQYIRTGYGARANIGRNTLHLDPINDIDVTAVKRFTITERFRVEFLAQFLNVLNHPQYVGGFLNDIAPVGFTGAERSVLLPASSDFNHPETQFASNARAIQLALKIFF